MTKSPGASEKRRSVWTSWAMPGVCLVTLLFSGCAFDRSGVDPGWLVRADGGRDAAVDRAAPPDRGEPDRAAPKPDQGTPDLQPAQGKSCSSGNVKFTASAPPKACATLTVRVETGAPWGWVMVGVSDKTGAASATWKGGAKVIQCPPRYCWDYTSVKVPCTPGPFRFHFMRDAVNDDPTKGTIIGACTP